MGDTKEHLCKLLERCKSVGWGSVRWRRRELTESDIAAPCPEVLFLLKYFRKWGHCLSILWIFKYTVRSPTLPIANSFQFSVMKLAWVFNPDFNKSVWGCPFHLKLLLLTSVFWLRVAPPFWWKQVLGSDWEAPPVPPLSLPDAALCTPSRRLPCPVNTNVSGRALVLSLPMSPSSSLAVTSRYYSYRYIPLWHFSLAVCPCAVIILADSSTSIIS